MVPNGSLGFRRDHAHWNLTLETDPALTMYGKGGGAAEVLLARFDEGSALLRRGVPVVRVGEHVVTTVYDLLLAQYGVARDGLPGTWPTGYDDALEPYTPGWQEPITGGPGGRGRSGSPASWARPRCAPVAGA
ncbi:hypothetical protein [Nonomuraea dietziae]|uniref:hypothetical protein n=1 Tax=Nonomuraea dietziae TaxID=65515 RepID=UPI0031D09EDB